MSVKRFLRQRKKAANKKAEKEISELRLRLQKQKKLLQQRKKCIQTLKCEEKQKISTAVNEALTKIFSENQIKIVTGKQTRVRWTSEEISKAFTLRYLSKGAYLYVKNDLKYPLPSMPSLRRWAKTLEMRGGILNDIINVLEVTGQDRTEMERITAISFDEMKVTSILEYDPLHDQVIGPHNQLQVIMARGFCAKWKQSVYLEFDQKMILDIIFKIIQKLHSIGYPVFSCTSDLGGGNRALLKDLGVSFLNASFKSPGVPHDITFFPDAPHLLKLLRNWLIDTGFMPGDGRIVNKEPLERLINILNRTEVRICHKLTPKHLKCQGSERQNVRLAAELLSHSTAAALKECAKEINSEYTDATSEFIDLIDKWFHLMNVYVPGSTFDPYFKKPFSGTDEQNTLLTDVYSEIENLRCIGKGCIQIFQKGILQSINALRSLLKNLHHYNLKYILTHKLNQDVLENLFSQIRTRGGLDDHPTPLHAIHRLRMIILGKTPGVVKHGTNTLPSNTEDFAVATALQRMKLSVLDGISSEQLCSDTDTASEGEQNGFHYVQEEVSLCSTTENSELENVDTALLGLESKNKEKGLNFLAGWVARKFKKSYPELGTCTYKVRKETCHDYAAPEWIDRVSCGGLTKPATNFFHVITKAEQLLSQMWGDEIPKSKGVVEKYTTDVFNMLDDGLRVHRDVIKAFVRQRLFIRIKYQNLHSSNLQAQRKLKQNLKNFPN